MSSRMPREGLFDTKSPLADLNVVVAILVDEDGSIGNLKTPQDNFPLSLEQNIYRQSIGTPVQIPSSDDRGEDGVSFLPQEDLPISSY